MTFEQLRVFIAVAEQLSFTRAAELLYLSQPAVSQHVQSLERHMGTQLFERRGRKFELSQAGETLLGYAHQILRLAADAETAIQELRETVHGRLQLGTTETIGSYLLPELIGRFSREHPNIQVSLRMRGPGEVISSVVNGDMDLAVVEEAPGAKYHDQLITLPFRTGEVVLIVSPEHPFASLDTLHPWDVTKLPLIVRQVSDRTRVFWTEKLAEAGVYGDRLTIAFELDNTEGIKRAVMANLGAGFVSTYAVERELELGLLKTIKIAGIDFTRTIWAITPVRQHPPRRIQVFLEYLQRVGMAAPQPVP